MKRCGSTKSFPWGKVDRPEGVVDEGLKRYGFPYAFYPFPFCVQGSAKQVNISDYLPFFNLITWNTFHFAAALVLFLFCIWLGWGMQWRHMAIYLVIAVAIYIPALLLWHCYRMPLIILGGLICSMVTLSLPGLLLGKIFSSLKQKIL